MQSDMPLAKAETRWTRVSKGRVPIYIPYLFLIPAFILLILFRYFPALSAVYHSFTDWNGTQPANFVGLEQYQALAQDPVFLLSLKNILIYTAARTVLVTVMALVGAELVYNLHSHGWRSFWRVLFTVPLIIPTTVVFLIWRRVFAGDIGLLNEALKVLGMQSLAQPWLGQTDTALPALIVIGFPLVSTVGFLVMLAALENLPPEVNDAALLDGCGPWRRIFSIDLPAIRGPLALITILSINAGLQEFAPMLIITGGGGPVNATQSPGLYLYQQAFTYNKFGYATAIGTVLMLITLAFSMFILFARYRRAVDVEV
jgi:raffinose/stachyose/melibiose transport system permease protein